MLHDLQNVVLMILDNSYKQMLYYWLLCTRSQSSINWNLKASQCALEFFSFRSTEPTAYAILKSIELFCVHRYLNSRVKWSLVDQTIWSGSSGTKNANRDYRSIFVTHCISLSYVSLICDKTIDWRFQLTHRKYD